MEFESVTRPERLTTNRVIRVLLEFLSNKFESFIDAITPKNPEDFPLFPGILPQDQVAYYLRQQLISDDSKEQNGLHTDTQIKESK